MTTTPRVRTLTIAAAAAGLLALGVPAAADLRSGAPAAATTAAAGWAGVTRQPVSIDMGAGWTARGELDYPARARGKLPVVVLLHGSGHNDRDQTLPDGAGSTFVPLAQAITDRGYAVLRFDKRGVTGVGPTLTDDQTQLAPPRPYERILKDAAAVVRFAAGSPRIDPSRIFLLGHSEGTQVAANLAADPAAAGIPAPAGVIAMGVVGNEIKDLLTYQLYGVKLARLHEEFDVDGDGYLTGRETEDGLIGQPAADVTAYRAVLGPDTDTDADGRLAIDAEVGPVLRESTGIDAYPNVPDLPQPIRDYAADIARFGTVTEELPRYAGPTLLLNGATDIQTPARSALIADAAVAAAGRRDHRVVIYPGMAHTMHVAPKFTPGFGEPDPRVLTDIRSWLGDHR